MTIERADEESVCLSVLDRGLGIPEDFKSRVFEKFAQADTSDARQKGGTGLGLSIVKQIVERLGGKVSFDGVPGGGTVFSVVLPSRATETAPMPAPETQAAQLAPPEKGATDSEKLAS